MTRPLTVRDRHGNLVERADGVMQDGDRVHGIRVPMMLADSAAAVTPATLASAAQILGDAYNETELANLTDTMARHAVVRKRIGAAAEGRGSIFLDAAWGTLAGTNTASSAPKQASGTEKWPVLTDAQKAFAADAVKQALADHAGNPATTRDASQAVADADKAERKREMTDAWKSKGQRAEEAILDGLSYTERMALTSGAHASHAKASDRKVSDAEFYKRQRQWRDRHGSAA